MFNLDNDKERVKMVRVSLSMACCCKEGPMVKEFSFSTLNQHKNVNRELMTIIKKPFSKFLRAPTKRLRRNIVQLKLQ